MPAGWNIRHVLRQHRPTKYPASSWRTTRRGRVTRASSAITRSGRRNGPDIEHYVELPVRIRQLLDRALVEPDRTLRARPGGRSVESSGTRSNGYAPRCARANRQVAGPHAASRTRVAGVSAWRSCASASWRKPANRSWSRPPDALRALGDGI
jgi:hypothetical protein